MKKILTIGLISILSVTLIFSLALAKKDQKAWIGIITQSVDDDLAEAFDLDTKYGAIINEVVPDSPAEEAGLLEGDVVIAYNSKKVYDYDDLLDYLEDSSPNDKISLTIMRESNKMNFDVQLEKAPRDAYQSKYRRNGNTLWSAPNVPNVPAIPNIPQLTKLYNLNNGHFNYSYGSSSYIGVQLSDLTDQLREYFGITDDVGVLVSQVEEDSPAEKAGLKAGDIIIKADKYDIEDYRDLKETIADKDEGDIVSLTFIRDKKQNQVDVTVAEDEDSNTIFYNAPDISFQIPKNAKNNAYFLDNMHDFFNSEDFQEEMANLEKELSKLKDEMNNKNSEKRKSAEYKRQLEELKKELSADESETNKELKEAIQQLKEQVKALEKKLDD